LCWKKLESDSKFKFKKEVLRRIIFGSSKEENRQARKDIIKGLLQERTVLNMTNLLSSKKVALEILDYSITLTWNLFYDFIWKTRCSAVSEWEKSIGISSREKRRSFAPDSDKNVPLESKNSSFGNLAQERKALEKDKEEKIREVWNEAILCLIQSGETPFWTSF
jgi:hypothetical protein